MHERLQKILSARGISSRRKAEEYIEQGLVKVNGTVAKIGDKADPSVDTIEVDGEVLKDRAQMLYYVMNKPEGVQTTNIGGTDCKGAKIAKWAKDQARVQGSQRVQRFQGNKDKSSLDSLDSSESLASPSVRDLLPAHLQGKIYPVGRLDKDSSGLLLFTNDGVLAYRLTHPRFDHEKEYEVILDRPISPIACRKIAEGYELDGMMTKPMNLKKVAPNKVRIVLTEGRNRQIRRICQYAGYTVKILRRIRIMNFTDDQLRPGAVRALTEAEKAGLLKAVGV